MAFHHDGAKTLALLNLKDLEERLPARHFIRVQKSFIIPIRKVTGIQGNLIRIRDDNANIQLGAIYKSEFLDRLKDRLIG